MNRWPTRQLWLLQCDHRWRRPLSANWAVELNPSGIHFPRWWQCDLGGWPQEPQGDALRYAAKKSCSGWPSFFAHSAATCLFAASEHCSPSMAICCSLASFSMRAEDHAYTVYSEWPNYPEYVMHIYYLKYSGTPKYWNIYIYIYIRAFSPVGPAQQTTENYPKYSGCLQWRNMSCQVLCTWCSQVYFR